MTDELIIPFLTAKQPWAWTISDGPKGTENRGRRMVYRGPLWLHVGARSGWDRAGEQSPLVRQAWAAYARSRPDAHQSIWRLHKDTAWMPFGAVVALVRVIGCHHASECGLSCAPWAAAGQFHIELAEHVARLAKPVAHRGQRGLQRLSAAAEAACHAQIPAGEWPR